MEHPTQFEDYTVEAHLGTGAFGQTYRVRNSAGELYALKWSKEQYESKSDLAQRFQNEIWALGKLAHPCIPALKGTGEHLGRSYFVMSLADGETLLKVLERQIEERGPMSEQRVLNVAEALLDALAHSQGKGVFHRDVKHANIIVSPSLQRVTLVDFGFCKSVDQPGDPHTFWNAGASRTSPPSKLKYPAVVHPTHDTFSVGVIAYTLLTNQYPYQVPSDAGELEDQMRHSPAKPIGSLNTLVRDKVSEFFMRLIIVDDDKRPQPEEALVTCRDLLRTFQEENTSSYRTVRRGGIYTHVMRDPLHGDIPMTDFEWRLISTKEFQRLRWIRQLGAANLVYMGAEHTRFAHAIGTMHVASEILRRMEERLGTIFNDDERMMARTYALIHDTTHIAYGHTLEDELGLFPRHDRNAERINRLILSKDSAMGDLLQSTSFGRAVLTHFDSAATALRRSWLTDLIESPSGADVLDYIDRDSMHCGLDHKVDSAIYRRFVIDTGASVPREERHMLTQLWGKKGLRVDAEFALESLLRERFALFMKVYTHPSKISAGAMIGKAIRESSESERTRQLSERQIEWMSDAELLVTLKHSDRPAAKFLAEHFLNRDVYKPVFRAQALKGSNLDTDAYRLRRERFASLGLFDPERVSAIEADLAKKSKLKSHEVIVYCPSTVPGLQKVRHYVQLTPTKQTYRDEVDDTNRKMHANHMRLWHAYVFAPPTLAANTRNSLAEAAEDFFKLENDIAFDRRQMVLPLEFK